MKRLAIAVPALLVISACAARNGDRDKDDASVTATVTQAVVGEEPVPPRLRTILDRHRMKVIATTLDGDGPDERHSSFVPVIRPAGGDGFEPVDADARTHKPSGLRARLPSNVAPAALIGSTLPAEVSGALRLEDARDHKMSVQAVLEGASPVAAVTARGLAFYEGAGPSRADIVERVDENGTEDFFVWDEKPSREEIRYRVGMTGVVGLRLVDNVLEFLDAEARPRIRINRPNVIGADGTSHPGKLAVQGCAVDTNPLPPVHRDFVHVQSNACEIIVTWGEAAGDPVSYPAILDPSWTSGATMNTARADFSATPFYLSNEMILVAGGYPTTSQVPTNTAEILDETGGGWFYTTSPMSVARFQHRASAVNTTGAYYGDVLITGGVNVTGNGSSIQATAERWSPSTGAWTSVHVMNTGHAFHSQTMLKTGRVLVVSGYSNGSSSGPATAVAEIYDLATDSWLLAPPVGTPRANTASVLLAGGRVLFAGGNNNAYTAGFVFLSSCEIFDPAAPSWTTNTPPLAQALTRGRLNLLQSGGALFSGGLNTSNAVAQSQVYDPLANAWSSPKSMNVARIFHATALLNNGQVLAAGGENYVAPPTSAYVPVSSAELYDPALDSWTPTNSMITARSHHTWVADDVGTVWVMGGKNTTTSITATVERFNPANPLGATCNGPSDCSSGYCVDGVCCNKACNASGCLACKASVKGQGVDGYCGFIVAGQDPHNTCPTQLQSTCGADGSCDGAGACRVYAAGTTCRPAAGGCDTPETCPGGGAACPTDTKLAANTACPSGADTNPCTLDICDGTNATCQHPAGNAGAVCRAAAGSCDITETCSGTSTACPTDAKEPNTYVCRQSAGDCDIAEKCDGTTVTCPSDTKVAANAACPSGADSNLCTQDICDGTNVACQHPAGNAGTVCRPAAGDCDLAEACSGTSTTCPNDSKVAANTACPSGADSNVCTADICDGTNISCQHPAGNAGTVCRAAVGACDAVEACTGTSTSCPADAKQPVLYVCRPASSGGCDMAETCDGSSNSCPADGFQSSSFQCRAASCDTGTNTATLAANCTGTSALCPSVQTQSCSPSTCNGTVCGGCTSDTACPSTQYCSSGVCTDKKGPGAACGGDNQCSSTHCADGVCCNTSCNAGVCDSCIQPNLVGTCSPVPAATVCRQAADACDAPETCGGGTTCPADVKVPSGSACPDDGNACTTDLCNGTSNACQHAAGNAGTVCRAANGTACDIADACDGVSTTCADAKRPNTYVCRPAAGECDVADHCDGVNDGCPTDILQPNGSACTDDGNVCTTDKCDGANAACQHPAGNAGTVCKPSSGPCDLADVCSGTSTVCVDLKQSTSFVCRAAAGECDQADACDGVTDTCPSDAKKVSGTACTDDGNPCTKDVCGGSSDLCQHAPGNAGSVCRAAAGVCDAAETCDGLSSLCPADAKQPNTTVCRTATGACDLSDACDGVSNTCPTDAYQIAGTICQPGSCTAGVVTLPATCTGSSASCPPPTTQTCPSGCSGTTCANPCTSDGDCAPPTAPDGGVYADAGVGGYCSAAGVCTPKIDQGKACSRDGECATGHCADGYCCNTACSAGVCDSCAIVKGTCSPVAASTVCRPSTGECDVEETCGGSLNCPADATLDGQPCSTDGEICTTDVCSGKTCAHVAAPPITVCRAAGNECDVAETCGGATSCPPDGRQPDGTTCTDDGSPCSSDVCEAGICQHPAGNPGVVCRPAAGECDSAESCDGISPACPTDLYATNSTPCTSDNNVCTVDACQSGVCSHVAGNKDVICRVAANECDLLERCDGSSSNCPPDGYRADGTTCTADTNPCTTDVCRSGACAHPAGNSGALCRPAASVCDVSESCDGVSTDCPADGFLPNDTPCIEDGKVCTYDACQAGVCSHIPTDGASCNDGNACTTPDTCNAGSCSGAPVSGCTCTVDADCNDGNVCNGVETCVSGTCTGGTPLDCDDGQSCTADGCNFSTGCIHNSLVDGAPCSDGNYCTVGDMCAAGKCTAGTARVCTNAIADPCQVPACDPVASACGSQAKTNGTSCNDNNLCTQNDACQAGVCTGQALAGCCTTAANCNDNDSCTTDACNTTLQTCTHTPIPGCVDGGPDGAVDSGGVDGGTGGSDAGTGGAAGSSGSGGTSGTDGGVSTGGIGGTDGGPDAATRVDASAGSNGKGEATSRSPLGCRCETVGTRSPDAPWAGMLVAVSALASLGGRRRGRHRTSSRR